MAPTAVPIDAVLANGDQANPAASSSGDPVVNGHTPRTPSLSGLSLTEYTANPSPPCDSQAAIKKLLPDEYLLPNGNPDYVRLIITSRVYDACKETSLTPAVNLSGRLECNVLLKREDEQPVFSFKLRGAYNKMAHLDPVESWKGVIACSAGEGKEALLSVRIPERPGAFVELIDHIMPHAVTEFSYRYATDEEANVLVGISLTAPASQRTTQLQKLLGRINACGMAATDLSGDELAKTHIRYLVGGRSSVADERVYMFNFPERPGSLLKFLQTLRPRYNISLFQYRNSGSDVGKIIAGIQCPDAEVSELETFLKDIGYPWQDCTDSSVFKTFLRG